MERGADGGLQGPAGHYTVVSQWPVTGDVTRLWGEILKNPREGLRLAQLQSERQDSMTSSSSLKPKTGSGDVAPQRKVRV